MTAQRSQIRDGMRIDKGLSHHAGNPVDELIWKVSTHREPGGVTVIAGEVPDQAALHGLLAKVHDLGLPLVWVSPDDPQAPAPGASDATPQ